MARRKKGRKLSGWINLDKPYELGSTPAVSRVRWLFHAQKAGHAGTLDPLATGVLPIALGEATKTVSFMQDAAKTYRVSVGLGVSTTTDDMEGEPLETSEHRPETQEIKAALASFTGEIQQVPPQFSAIRKDGVRAYTKARAGESVELEARNVRIDHIRFLRRVDADHFTLEVDCGKGVYIRSLARDLARQLGTQGHVTKLRRTRVGPFDEKSALGLDKLTNLGHSTPDLAALDACLLPLTTALDDIPAVAISGDEASRIKQGQAISPQGLAVIGPVLLTHEQLPVAIAHQDGETLKPMRVFNL
ncbi:MAG: tRNA pseudouridine(55) synthase TruB [Rhodobiaceae bacterium]|nr:tRNA pseudouridine(55) synthase TruB [Rhodobiaceae bacterium]